MDDTSACFSGFLGPEMLDDIINYAEQRLACDTSGQHSRNLNTGTLASDDRTNESDIPSTSHTAFWKSIVGTAMEVRFSPPQILSCANVEASKYKTCSKPGTMACGECRLVSYCSKECQREHWKKHKAACKNVMRSDAWKPVWEREGRGPSYMTNMTMSEEFRLKWKEEFSVGMSLWGNTPAMDIINVAHNEKDEIKDFTLAFIASGDLHHVLSTINGLPPTYSGSLSILVNDLNPAISCRNIVLLLILGTIEDEALAVDMAIHFWYSTFMPIEYKLQLSVLIADFLMKMRISGETTIPLGENSTMSCCLLPKASAEYFSHLVATSVSVGDAQQEYDRVRTAPSRRDYRDRMYLGLRHSHRVAFEEYRRSGIVLPFGARKAHFNCPNQSLFSPGGKWMQTDYADPLEGWDMAAILAAGKSCGAQPEDIYGCLYFFLVQELRKSVQRIRNFKISFTVSTFEAGRVLPIVIRDGDLSELGVPPSTRFDRISVSNILDENYVGMKQVLTSWSPFLAQTSNAAIVGYFMNWFLHQPDGCSTYASQDALESVTKKLMERRLASESAPTSIGSAMNMLRTMAFVDSGDTEALYDSSAPFKVFLKKRGLDDVLRNTKFKLRMKHTIVPHRILAPLRGKPSDLPVFPDDESWYYNTKLTCFTWSERYVEFTRA